MINDIQRLWWRQARSDFDALRVLRDAGANPCHQLHYLQMITEKLARAAFWRRQNEPPKLSHAGFGKFLRRLGQRPGKEGIRVASLFGFERVSDFQTWLDSIGELAQRVETLAPQLAQDGPNPEYPWPRDAPLYAPADHEFDVWKTLSKEGRGEKFLAFLRTALERFEEFA